MRLATIIVDGQMHLAICRKSAWIPIRRLNEAFNTRWPTTMDRLIETGQISPLNDWYRQTGQCELDKEPHLSLRLRHCAEAPLYRHPSKIWGIGLNYREHAKDLSERSPTSAPASFMKPDTTIIGPGDAIKIPKLSQKTTERKGTGFAHARPVTHTKKQRLEDLLFLGRRCARSYKPIEPKAIPFAPSSRA
jgi:hypothetical protein